MDTDTILRKLSEWKERILFCAVLLCVLYVARNATLTGAGIDTIDRETRQAAIGASGVDEQTGMRALERLQKPPDISPTPPDPAQVNRLFYDERDVYRLPRPSGWMLGQENFERLPPLPISVPDYPLLTDFDMPTGTMPDLSRARGIVPRDLRKVTLSDTDTSEFKD
ncbi:MAG: hypothetical protein KF754_15165 [Planctomycetes bacterium]|nr:hypothetical protein [Planctomycetota bacterium]